MGTEREGNEAFGGIEVQPLAARLENLVTEIATVLQRGNLSEHDRKLFDLARRELQLDLYALRKSEALGHAQFLAEVRRQIAAGQPDDPGLDIDDLEALARGA